MSKVCDYFFFCRVSYWLNKLRLIQESLRPRPHVSEYFWIRNFFRIQKIPRPHVILDSLRIFSSLESGFANGQIRCQHSSEACGRKLHPEKKLPKQKYPDTRGRSLSKPLHPRQREHKVYWVKKSFTRAFLVAVHFFAVLCKTRTCIDIALRLRNANATVPISIMSCHNLVFLDKANSISGRQSMIKYLQF